MRFNSNLLRKLRAIIAIRPAINFGIVLITVFASCSLAVAADIPTGKPQIQGGNLRIEFDNRLRSRVVARFDKTETVLGPFTASETVTTAGKLWTGFLLTSQKQGRIKDAFGEGERLTVEGKAGTLTKMVSVTVYDDFPTMAFFDVQYTNTGTTALAVKSWTNNAYTMNAQPGAGPARFLVLPEWLLREASQLGATAARQFSAGELSRHECQRLWRRYADCRRLAA
jgi:alpha-galactosidase